MTSYKNATEQHRVIQAQVMEADRLRPVEEMKGAMQAGARIYPEPPFPTEALSKPGSEASQTLAPMYDAPFYKGSGKLENKIAVITGGDSGIGRAVDVLFAREGADVAILYLGDEEDEAPRPPVPRSRKKVAAQLPSRATSPNEISASAASIKWLSVSARLMCWSIMRPSNCMSRALRI